MGDEMDESALERQLNTMRMYEEFEDCRHLVDDIFDYARENRVVSYHVEAALELAHGDFIDKQRRMKRGPGYDERLRQLKVDVLTGARDYVTDMAKRRVS